MTEEKQNIAIYKLLGYEPRRMWRFWIDKEKNHSYLHFRSKDEALDRIKGEKTSWPYTEYPQDFDISEPEEYDDWSDSPNVNLDILNEAEEMLKPSQTTEYFVKLEKIVAPIHATLRVTDQSWHAKTPQRREALLKTLKLWEE